MNQAYKESKNRKTNTKVNKNIKKETQIVPEWFNKDIKKEVISKEEEEEVKDLLKEFV